LAYPANKWHLTGDHDGPCSTKRIVLKLPRTSGKKQQETNPTLIRIDVNAGHGAGKSKTEANLI